MLRVTAENQGAAVGGREMHVEHLDRCELVEHSSRREARRQRLESCTQRDVQAIGQERHEDVRLDAVLDSSLRRWETYAARTMQTRGKPDKGSSAVGKVIGLW